MFNSCFSCPNSAGGVQSDPDYGEHWGCTPTDAYPTAAPTPTVTHNFFVKFPPKMQEYNPNPEFVRVCDR